MTRAFHRPRLVPRRWGLSVHQYALPGEPASHACVRLLERDARWLYEWGESWRLDEAEIQVLEEGTPVWILGEYAYDQPPPWLDPDEPHPPLEVELQEVVGLRRRSAAREWMESGAEPPPSSR